MLVMALVVGSIQVVGAAKGFPSRPITVVVGFGAGGFTDLFGRLAANEMSKDLGVAVSVVNMPGGTGGIAAEYVRNAAHDGHTIWAFSDALRLQAVMGYHPTTVKEWVPMVTASFAGAVSVRADSPHKTFADVVKAAKSGKVTASASSPGTTWQTELDIITKYTGVNFKYIPYAGSHPSQVAAMAGEVDIVLTGIGEQAELIRAKKLRPLAVFDNETYDFPGYGKIPPITDYLPNLNPAMPFGAWVGLAVPANTPKDVVETLQAAYQKAVASSTIKEFAATNHCKLLGLTGAKAVSYVSKDTSLVSWLLQDLGTAKSSPTQFGIAKP
jgi:tripartite-type tricarboxylate transporter receptor subunit TctC